jgi:uncharacterized protein (DUF1684 family)
VDPREHAQLIEKWREARLRRLISPTGWLTVVDRIELSPGENAVPFGVVTLRGESAELRVRDDAVVTVGGERVSDRILSAEGTPEALSYAGRIYELVRRDGTYALRVKDPLSAARLAFAGLSHFPIDLGHRVVARFEPTTEKSAGRAHFTLDGRPFSLQGNLERGSNRLFFSFGDDTNRRDSYPAGRFLYAEVPTSDEVVVDFNLAFNPPCAFTELVACPVVPRENHLPVAITAGEKRYGESH